MQKLLFAFVSLCLIVSCSTTPNNNGGTTTTVVPLAPTNLTGSVTNVTHVNLTWTDNATNEDGYKIERKIGNGTYALLGSTGVNINQYTDSTVAVNTTYTYRVYAYNAAGNSLNYSNEYTATINPNVTIVAPTVATASVGSITNTTAVCGGTITSNGGATVTASGVVWSTSPSPTISLLTKTTDGTSIGSYNSNITGLIANTTYYVRAYATNIAGTSYGIEQNFTTTISGGTTNLSNVTICNQTWTTQNLSVSRYRNGDVIPQVTDATQWQNLTTGAWCWYNNDSVNYSQYGRFYNWYAVNDPRGLAPTGWHVPTDAEWNKLTKCIDPAADTTTICCTNVAGTAMKTTSGWYNNGNGTNSSGFAGLPGGSCNGNGAFVSIGYYGLWWSSTENNNNTTDAWYRYLYYDDAVFYRSYYGGKTFGFSVRLVRD